MRIGSVREIWRYPVKSMGGESVAVRAASLCLHGDSPGAVDTARRVAQALRDAGVTLAPFA